MIDGKYLESFGIDSIDTFEGRLVILYPEMYSGQFRYPKYLIVRATGGFGCRNDTVGRAVYYQCPYDSEVAQTDRGAIQYIIKKEYEKEVIDRYCK